jgi:hypothetical protein
VRASKAGVETRFPWMRSIRNLHHQRRLSRIAPIVAQRGKPELLYAAP